MFSIEATAKPLEGEGVLQSDVFQRTMELKICIFNFFSRQIQRAGREDGSAVTGHHGGGRCLLESISVGAYLFISVSVKREKQPCLSLSPALATLNVAAREDDMKPIEIDSLCQNWDGGSKMADLKRMVSY